MVVFEDGLARKSEYRRFSVRGTGGEGDVASIHEVITRRFRRYLEERETTGELDVLGDPAQPDRPGRDRPGIRPAAQVRLPAEPGGDRRRAGAGRGGGPRRWTSWASTTSRVCGLAKRLEEVWLPGEDAPVDPAAQQRGPVPAAAGAGRGAPLRHHLPPGEAVEGAAPSASSTAFPGWARPAGLRCYGTSARSAGSPRPPRRRWPRLPGIGAAAGRARCWPPWRPEPGRNGEQHRQGDRR